jgi:hypothetical protein
MTKKRYFTISKKGRYGSDEVLFRFENLDGAMAMFKYLLEGKSVELDHESTPAKKEPDEDQYVPDDYFYIEKPISEPDFHLGSETVEVYTRDEFNELKKERQDYIESFKKKGVKK